MNNKQIMELVEKAINDSSLFSSGGKMNPQQASRFIDYVFDETKLKDVIRQEKFSSEELEIDKIGINKRVAFAADEGKDPGYRVNANFGKIKLKPMEVIVPLELTQTFKEINIEGKSITDTIMRLVAKALANNLEQQGLMANSVGGGPAITPRVMTGAGSTTQYILDRFMGQHDGWFKQVLETGNVVDMNDEKELELSAYAAQMAMDTGYQSDLSQMRFMMSQRQQLRHHTNLRLRQTVLGDQATAGMIKPLLSGVEPMPLPLLPDRPTYVEEVTLTGTTAVALDFNPIRAAEVVVTPEDLASTPTTPYVNVTDYVITEATGTIARAASGSAITSGQTVKVTYKAGPQMLYTWPKNLIQGIGREITMETDRDVIRRADILVVTLKVAYAVEEPAGATLVTNMSDQLLTA